MYFEIFILIIGLFCWVHKFQLGEGEFKTKIPFGLITVIINIFQTIEMRFQGCPFGLIWFKKWMVQKMKVKNVKANQVVRSAQRGEFYGSLVLRHLPLLLTC